MSYVEGATVPVQGLAQQSSGSSNAERTDVFQGLSEPGCIIKALASFRQE